SDSPESAEREISLFFESEELTFYKKDADAWIY
ncbi:MAG: nucleoside-diphosphate kinase, partial [Priestia megaterium]